MADFNSKITRILREFDDEYADLDDQDEFTSEERPEPPMPLVGTKQFGNIVATLHDYYGDNALTFEIDGGPTIGFGDHRFPQILNQVCQMLGTPPNDGYRRIDTISRVIRQENNWPPSTADRNGYEIN